MLKLNILYPATVNGRFDFDYYHHVHMPMSIEKFGTALKGVSVEKGLNAGTEGSQPVYVAMAHLMFDSFETFEKAFNPISATLIADMPNYTDITPVYQFSEVMIYK